MPSIRAFGLIGALWYGWDFMKHVPVYPIDKTYLSMVGVNRSSQGQGIGKALVQYAINNADGHGVVLTTMNPKNVQIYQRLGFLLMHEKQTESGDSNYRPRFTTYHMAYPIRLEKLHSL